MYLPLTAADRTIGVLGVVFDTTADLQGPQGRALLERRARKPGMCRRTSTAASQSWSGAGLRPFEQPVF